MYVKRCMNIKNVCENMYKERCMNKDECKNIW